MGVGVWGVALQLVRSRLQVGLLARGLVWVVGARVREGVREEARVGVREGVRVGVREEGFVVQGLGQGRCPPAQGGNL